jgi:DNA polymerase I-like protein with 3'-5' exonuclease and polymerase domains
MTISAVLVDARNWAQMKAVLLSKMSTAGLVGFDIETEDSEAREGIKQFRGAKSAKCFDLGAIKVTGFSLYFDKDPDQVAYYVNLRHADVQNRVPWEEAQQVLDAKPEGATWISHKAPFEITMMMKGLGYALSKERKPNDIICTMQMAVSAYDADQYAPERLFAARFEALYPLLMDVKREFATYQLGQDMTPAQSDLFYKVVAKESDSAWSWNGLVDEMTYGHSLKKAVQSWFGHKMTTYDECLRGREHMGQLTGEEVVAYGADDAYWAVQLFHKLLAFMMQTNPRAWQVFIEQENPMIYVYADTWMNGMVVNQEAIEARRGVERAECAKVIRKLKTLVRSFQPWAPTLHEKLTERDDWYRKNGASYRKRIDDWAKQPDSDDDFTQCMQISGAVSSAWATERGRKGKLPGPNFTHYMMMRTLLYDLLREEKLIVSEGKTQSDGDARGFLLKRFDNRIAEAKEAVQALNPKLDTLECSSAGLEQVKLYELIGLYERKKELVHCINALAGIEQRMKLYLNPYMLLKDPVTGRLYPELTSMLVTHRLAGSNPNPMQLSKEGESTYVRGFFLPDRDDHLIMSIDWKQIELVLIGEDSGDPEFAKAYGQLPYKDLHLGAAAAILSAEWDTEVTAEMFASLKKMEDDIRDPFGFPLLDNTGTVLTPKQAYKYNRGTAGGKGANFGYWYSGALASVALARGVGQDMMWRMTEAYRATYPVAEAWRVGLIEFVNQNGYVDFFDGHRRTRLEATMWWREVMAQKFAAYGSDAIARFGHLVANKIARRAGNQAVNARIQGGCATLAKRSIRRINEEIRGCGFDARFMIPVHDELIFSVNRREIWPFMRTAKGVMTNHPDIIKTLKMDCSAAIGRTFEPFHQTKAPWGQVELDEAPKITCLDAAREGAQLNQDEVEAVTEWLYREAA